MKWLKSTTQKSWVASCNNKQIIIPQNETADNRRLALGDDAFAEVSSLPGIASLIKAGGIMVLDQEPEELKNSIPALQVSNTQLKAELDAAKERITTLETQLKDTNPIDIEAIRDEVRRQCEVEKQQALEEAQQKYQQLEAEATQALANKDAEITKLEKKLKKGE